MSDKMTMDPSGFVVLADFVPQIVQEIRYYSTYNFIGDRIDGYEEPCAILTREAARAFASGADGARFAPFCQHKASKGRGGTARKNI